MACVAVAVGIELAQAWRPLRTPSLGDVAAGLAGAAVGWALLEALRRVRAGGGA
jgi:VanZ family protein